LYRLELDPDFYFSYGMPALVALACGWFLSLWRLPPLRQLRGPIELSSTAKHSLDICIVVGILSMFLYARLASGGQGGGIAAIVFLIANLRYVGLTAWILAAAPGWKPRLVVVLFIELLRASAAGFLLDLVLWSVAITILCFYRFQLTRKTIATILLLGAVLLPCLQHAKWKYRSAIWFQSNYAARSVAIFETDFEITPISRPFIICGLILESGVNLLMLRWEPEFFSDAVVRYNQSWIVERVMTTVPDRVPYAEGETVSRAVVDSFLPRFLFPDKMESGGAILFTRFTGVELNETTSMNLGYTGEMYANFGYLGGILGCGIYGLALGLVYRWLVVRANIKFLYIACIPYVMQMAVLGEVGIFEVTNYTIKALVIVIAVSIMFPRFLAGQLSTTS
jgi:hypothetical protein